MFSGTVRENILFGQPYRKKWYNKVVKACALNKVNFLRSLLKMYTPKSIHIILYFMGDYKKWTTY